MSMMLMVAEGNLPMVRMLHEKHQVSLTLGYMWGITLLDFAAGKRLSRTLTLTPTPTLSLTPALALTPSPSLTRTRTRTRTRQGPHARDALRARALRDRLRQQAILPRAHHGGRPRVQGVGVGPALGFGLRLGVGSGSSPQPSP